jgi:hypothetical protein
MTSSDDKLRTHDKLRTQAARSCLPMILFRDSGPARANPEASPRSLRPSVRSFPASVSGVPEFDKMLINSAPPREAHRREEQIMATSVDLGTVQTRHAELGTNRHFALAGVLVALAGSSSPGAFRYRIQNHRALDIAHDHDHDQSVLHDVLIDAKH